MSIEVANHPPYGTGETARLYEELRIKERLEYLRSQIEAECISWFELAELQSLAEHIEPDDVQLLEWAGVPEA